MTAVDIFETTGTLNQSRFSRDIDGLGGEFGVKSDRIIFNANDPKILQNIKEHVAISKTREVNFESILPVMVNHDLLDYAMNN